MENRNKMFGVAVGWGIFWVIIWAFMFWAVVTERERSDKMLGTILVGLGASFVYLFSLGIGGTIGGWFGFFVGWGLFWTLFWALNMLAALVAIISNDKLGEDNTKNKDYLGVSTFCAIVAAAFLVASIVGGVVS